VPQSLSVDALNKLHFALAGKSLTGTCESVAKLKLDALNTWRLSFGRRCKAVDCCHLAKILVYRGRFKFRAIAAEVTIRRFSIN